VCARGRGGGGGSRGREGESERESDVCVCVCARARARKREPEGFLGLLKRHICRVTRTMLTHGIVARPQMSMFGILLHVTEKDAEDGVRVRSYQDPTLLCECVPKFDGERQPVCCVSIRCRRQKCLFTYTGTDRETETETATDVHKLRARVKD
jgi:hypothetical protein